MEQELLPLAWLIPVCLLLIGLCVGSFLNVVIYRLPLMMEAQWRGDCCELLELEPEKAAATQTLNLAVPNSHCPQCKAAVQPWQNIPVVSYVLLGGKCGNCAEPISLRYPSVELVTGLLTLALTFILPFGPALFGAILLTWALVALTMIDIDHQLLPDNITLPLLWLGLAFNVSATFAPLQDAVIGAIAGYLSLWSVYWIFKLLTGKDGMGYGDFKLLAALGAWLGWQQLPMIIIFSSVIGVVGAIVLMLLKKQGKDIPIPFGPYLAVAGWIALLWGDMIMQQYLSASGLQ